MSLPRIELSSIFFRRELYRTVSPVAPESTNWPQQEKSNWVWKSRAGSQSV